MYNGDCNSGTYDLLYSFIVPPSFIEPYFIGLLGELNEIISVKYLSGYSTFIERLVNATIVVSSWM